MKDYACMEQKELIRIGLSHLKQLAAILECLGNACNPLIPYEYDISARKPLALAGGMNGVATQDVFFALKMLVQVPQVSFGYCISAGKFVSCNQEKTS